MGLSCTRCDYTGFINLHQVDEAVLVEFEETLDHKIILAWIEANSNHDVSICDCCGLPGEGWYGEPGEHNYHPFGNEPFPDCF